MNRICNYYHASLFGILIEILLGLNWSDNERNKICSVHCHGRFHPNQSTWVVMPNFYPPPICMIEFNVSPTTVPLPYSAPSLISTSSLPWETRRNRLKTRFENDGCWPDALVVGFDNAVMYTRCSAAQRRRKGGNRHRRSVSLHKTRSSGHLWCTGQR